MRLSFLQKSTFWLLIFVCFLGVTIDLVTTRIGIFVFGARETNPLGNMPFIEYSTFMLLTTMIFSLADWFTHLANNHRMVITVGNMCSASVALLPYIAVIHNVLALG